jgi:V-type H+-transporting ATPase subunit F
MANVSDNRTLIALISDEDTATGLLLAGIGHVSSDQSDNKNQENGGGGRHQGSGGADLINDSEKAQKVAQQCLERNFFIVTSTTNVSEIESAFQTYTQKREDIAILLITQPLAEKIRQICDRYEQAFPAVLEIPSKDAPYGMC